ncbi:MAG TPA: type II and III secretion system protein family protein [Xanthobacteraceae bacterium]|nr:type II and III secretion system protein family protein [Xanthobacteraceae bacterium]
MRVACAVRSPLGRSLALGLMIAGLAGPMLASTAGPASAERLLRISSATRTTTVGVAVGKSEDVRTDAGFVDILVGDPDVADVNPLTDHALSVLGKKIGTTRVSIYGEGKRLIGVFDVEVNYDTSRLAAEIARQFPHCGIRVSSVNGRIMLSGTAPDAPTVERVVNIARQFGPEIINSIQVMQAQQVMLEVRFIEMSRQASRELGVQWNVQSNNGRFIANIGDRSSALPISTVASTAAGVLSGTAPFGFVIGKLIGSGLEADVLINALEEKGLARSLAEPNLVALSGDTASFLAGGEFPVPVPGNLGAVTIDYKRYGVGLAFTPTVLSGGLVNLKIEPEVSQLDTSHPVQVAGISVPPLIVRRASTTVELRDGQSFVIGGLLQSTGQTAQQQLPWIGDVPVLGTLFRSAAYQKNETDLAIIVTPRIVRPSRPGDVVATPLDKTLPANDADLFLLGRGEVNRTELRVAAGLGRPYVGHMLDISGATHAIVQ